jgi:CRISPR-associated protein Csm5
MVEPSEWVLSKPETYETKRILLTSPMLHIGSAVSRLNPFEYVQTGSRVYLPNQEALARSLKQRGFLDQYIYEIENRNSIVSLLEKAFGDEWQKAKTGNGEPIFPRHLSSLKWTEERITDLRPMIRNGFGELYIPGSSIKGAIRTAIAYHLLKHSDRFNVPSSQRVSEIEQRLRRSMGDIRSKPKFVDDAVFMNQLFSDFQLIHDGTSAKGKTSLPNTDFMRAIQVADSQPFIEESIVDKQGKRRLFNLPVTSEVIVCSRFEDWRVKYKAPIFTEMVRQAKTYFTVKLDQAMLSWFHHQQNMTIPFKTIDELMEICREFAEDQWQHEAAYWQKLSSNSNARDSNRQSLNLSVSDIQDFYAKDCPYDLRLGWATGMNGTTISLLLDQDLNQKIRDTCHSRNQAPGFDAPKSRRVATTSDRSLKFVLGWVKFKVL